MKNLLIKILFLGVLITLMGSAKNVYACLCYGYETPYQTLKEATAVFTGKIISVKDGAGNEIIKRNSVVLNEDYQRDYGARFYRFAVQEWFKGSKESEVTVSHDINMCEFPFEVGDEFLIYAFESKGELYTSSFCSRTENLKTAQKQDVQFLREALKGLPEPRIYGSLQLNDNDLATNSFRSTYLQGIRVIAQSDKRQYIAITDKNGLFRFNNLPDGKYQVAPLPPSKFKYEVDYDTVSEITLTPEDFPAQYDDVRFTGSNAYTNIHLKWNNQITGKVLDAEGKPLEYGSIELIPVGQIDKFENQSFAKNKRVSAYIPRASEKSNIREFKFSGLTPGKYILAIEVYAPFAPDREKLRMYYPQGSNAQTAQIFNIGQLDRRIADLKLPSGYVVREIEGSFHWSSGTLVQDGTVSIEKKENSDDSDNVVYGSELIRDGKFKFQVFEGAEYWIHANIYNEKVKPIKIKIGKSNSPIKIVLPSLLKPS